jgi:hypothetical protein
LRFFCGPGAVELARLRVERCFGDVERGLARLLAKPRFLLVVRRQQQCEGEARDHRQDE